MLDSAGKGVVTQGQLQFLAERRERLDIPDGCRQRIPRRETQPPQTLGRRGWIDVSAARPVSTSQQTADGDVKPHQPSDEASRIIRLIIATSRFAYGNDPDHHAYPEILLTNFVPLWDKTSCNCKMCGIRADTRSVGHASWVKWVNKNGLVTWITRDHVYPCTMIKLTKFQE